MCEEKEDIDFGCLGSYKEQILKDLSVNGLIAGFENAQNKCIEEIDFYIKKYNVLKSTIKNLKKKQGDDNG